MPGDGGPGGDPNSQCSSWGYVQFLKSRKSRGIHGDAGVFSPHGGTLWEPGGDGDVAAASPAPNRCFSARAVRSVSTPALPKPAVNLREHISGSALLLSDTATYY